ncbi:hypothetical protein LUTEI9C_10092 [Luteimonas sp. 9C]|nr:hypothetical protein LUTEI9C_10092 [Luteimonas sp. 9C]
MRGDPTGSIPVDGRLTGTRSTTEKAPHHAGPFFSCVTGSSHPSRITAGRQSTRLRPW